MASVTLDMQPVPRPADPRPRLMAELERLRAALRAQPIPSAEERAASLLRLARALVVRQDALVEAVSQDFGHRSRHETLLADIYVTVQAARHAADHVAEWMAPQRRQVSWPFLPARAYVQYQPLGIVGIISPWNYPIFLALGPMVGALAAGNRVMLKPSELVPRTAEVMTAMLADVFPSDQVTVVTGGPEVGDVFSRLPLDHLVFTGSTRVGRLVMRAASENLVPVTLELGGKSPAIVAPDFPIETAAQRIMCGKLLNAGQTCIAPDYALVPASSRDAFVEAFKATAATAFPRFGDNPDYSSIINDAHYARLVGYLDDLATRGTPVIEVNPAGEKLDPAKRKLIPRLILDPPEEAPIMQDEIFGPFLPVKTYQHLSEAIAYVNDHPRPLSLYVFSQDRAAIERVVQETISGGVTVNETILHIAQDDLPFGGVGASGMGHYHGFDGFEALSKKKSICVQSRLNATSLLRPPYGAFLDRALGVLLRR